MLTTITELDNIRPHGTQGLLAILCRLVLCQKQNHSMAVTWWHIAMFHRRRGVVCRFGSIFEAVSDINLPK
jgi:hypothetical protein